MALVAGRGARCPPGQGRSLSRHPLSRGCLQARAGLVLRVVPGSSPESCDSFFGREESSGSGPVYLHEWQKTAGLLFSCKKFGIGCVTGAGLLLVQDPVGI